MKRTYINLLYLCMTIFLVAFSSTSFAVNYKWSCWGWESYSGKDHGHKATLNYSSDICVRDNDMPLMVDVYLHKIDYSGNSANSLDIDIIVKVINKDTNQSQVIRLGDRVSQKPKEYVKRFEFPVSISGGYNVEIMSINMTYRKNGMPTGSFNNGQLHSPARSGVAFITPKQQKSTINATVGNMIPKMYSEGGNDCKGRPGFDCNGFFLSSFEMDNDYWLKPDPVGDRISFTFMLKETAIDPYGTAGFILFPSYLLSTSNQALLPTLHCGFPMDAWTFYRTDHGCGASDLAGSEPCQSQGILTASDWLKHFDVAITGSPDGGKKICGFTFTGNNENDANAYKAIHDIIVHSTIRTTARYPWNEYAFHSWPKYDPSHVPVFSFFYMDDSKVKDTSVLRNGTYPPIDGDPRELAMRQQLSYYKVSGLYAPVVRINGHFPEVTFEVRPGDQSSEIPDIVQWGP